MKRSKSIDTSRRIASKTQERALRTRRELINAAKRILVRDGFQITRLDDVAKLAGKSRGALYAHFRDKEDLFFSIFEDEIQRTQNSASETSVLKTSDNEKVCFMPRQLDRVFRNNLHWLLYLELNLYARRSRHRSARFARILEQIRSRSPGAEFAAIFAILDRVANLNDSL